MPASTVAGCGKQKPANVSSEQDSNSEQQRAGRIYDHWERAHQDIVQRSLEKCYFHWKTQLRVGTISSCRWVLGTHTWKQAAGDLVVHTWGNDLEIAEDFSLVSWVMRSVSEWWVQAAGREFHHETVQFREWELSNFNVGPFFDDTLRTRCHKAHKSNLETETVWDPDALRSEQLRWH